jgi:hypothetical protein
VALTTRPWPLQLVPLPLGAYKNKYKELKV